jgi:hypothetical protein
MKGNMSLIHNESFVVLPGHFPPAETAGSYISVSDTLVGIRTGGNYNSKIDEFEGGPEGGAEQGQELTTIQHWRGHGMNLHAAYWWEMRQVLYDGSNSDKHVLMDMPSESDFPRSLGKVMWSENITLGPRTTSTWQSYQLADSEKVGTWLMTVYRHGGNDTVVGRSLVSLLRRTTRGQSCTSHLSSQPFDTLDTHRNELRITALLASLAAVFAVAIQPKGSDDKGRPLINIVQTTRWKPFEESCMPRGLGSHHYCVCDPSPDTPVVSDSNIAANTSADARSAFAQAGVRNCQELRAKMASHDHANASHADSLKYAWLKNKCLCHS